MFAPWSRAAFGVVALLSSLDIAFAQPGTRQPASPDYRGRDACPGRCSIAGANPSNWSVYHNLDQIQSCPEIIFYEFSLYDGVDEPDTLHRIYACTSYGPDWANLPNATTGAVTAQTVNNATYEIGWSPDDPNKLAATDIRTLSRQMRQYLENGYAAANRSAILFAQVGRASMGLYIGKGLQNEGTGSFALKVLHDSIPLLNATSGSLAMQLCQSGADGDHIFGLMATSNATFAPVQDALKSWSDAKCLSFEEGNRKRVTGAAFYATPSVISANGTNTTWWGGNSTSDGSFARRLLSRADCRTIQVVSGDGCASLATKCGISGADFTKYNSAPNLCSTLQPLQRVCCSAGTLPDFSPKPNPDGSCATYTVQAGDTCAGMAAANSLSVDKLTSFNKNTWAWNGCSNLWVGTIVCLSSGTPPMPAPIANTVCGPQVPGTQRPPAGTNLSTLNPCPLNACCDVWGQCGTTAEFCTDTGTGAPGTAAPGTNGCISNCGTTIVRSSAPSVFRNIAYFEGFNIGRPCLYQDAGQLDTSKYTHIHFAFGTLTPDYKVQIGDVLTNYEFANFKHIRGPKKILSFGGWTFSTDPSTYNIFRQGVTPANRLTMATNIANFINANDLDGVDIDWEYPGAPDIPGIPAADPNDGKNYLAFLATLKNLLPGKSVSIAAPSSYWYLKAFPIAQISKVVDYIIFMTYDLHGQWDANNQYSQPGCANGMCLRSNVNLTETVNALVMITKAGVPSNQVVVGVTSYGRSFEMAQAGCYGESCQYTGSASQSNAAKGPCTGTAGYISDAEIKSILKSGNVQQNFLEAKSNTNILVYNNTQWVGWMSPEVKASRKNIYKGLNMGGTTDWASDLEDYNDAPPRSSSWSSFILNVRSGMDPYQPGERHGNWTSVTCTDPAVEDIRHLSASQRWAQLDGKDAWSDVVDVWTQIDRPPGHLSFTKSVSLTIHGPQQADCGDVMDSNNCLQTMQCDGFEGAGSGAAGYEIWNSFVVLHEMYSNYYHSLYSAAAVKINPSLKHFENTFAPIPKPPSDLWLQLLLDFVGLGFGLISAPFFNLYLAKLPFFMAKGGSVDTLKDTTTALVGTAITVGKDLVGGGEEGNTWTVEKQDAFSDYLGQVINAWGNSTEVALRRLFKGDDASISTLTALISDGKLIEGAVDGSPGDLPEKTPPESDNALQTSIARAFFGYAIPAIWAVSGLTPFVIDSGYACGTIDPLGQYLSAASMHAAHGCYDGKLYYLAAPKGDAETCQGGSCDGCDVTCTGNYFSLPPGLDSLDGTAFGGITVSDLIIGSVRTYIQNGNQNGGPAADPANGGTRDDLYNQDVTTPGYVRMPVCSPEIAWAAWDKVGGPDASAPNYPCVIGQGISHCGDSTFVDQTSAASPSVEDCLTIVKNIQSSNAEWEVENAIGSQHQLVQFGSCKFGVQGKGKNGNIDFQIGGQDIVDIINVSVKMFGGSGKVGAKGLMSCDGTVKGQNVEWGLY